MGRIETATAPRCGGGGGVAAGVGEGGAIIRVRSLWVAAARDGGVVDVAVGAEGREDGVG